MQIAGKAGAAELDDAGNGVPGDVRSAGSGETQSVGRSGVPDEVPSDVCGGGRGGGRRGVRGGAGARRGAVPGDVSVAGGIDGGREHRGGAADWGDFDGMLCGGCAAGENSAAARGLSIYFRTLRPIDWAAGAANPAGRARYSGT